LLIAFSAAVLLGQNADSLEYFQRRAQLLAADSASHRSAINASDELASSAFYTEALEVLNDLVGSDSSSVRAPDTLPAARVALSRGYQRTFSASAGFDYTPVEDLADLDTTRQETKDSLLRINPYTGYLRAGLEFSRDSALVDRIEPSLYISDQKAGIGLDAHAVFAQIMNAGIVLRGEKRLTRRESISRTTPGQVLDLDSLSFVGDTRDSSDMLEAGGRLEIGSLSRGTLAAMLPLSFDHQQFRLNTRGYVSFTEFRAAPRLRLRANDMSRAAEAGLAADYKDFHIDRSYRGADSLDFFSLNPDLSLDWWLAKTSMNCAASLFYEQYTHKGNPRFLSSFSIEPSARHKFFPWLIGRIKGQYLAERARYDFEANETRDSIIPPGFPNFVQRDTLVAFVLHARYLLRGSQLAMIPHFEFVPAEWFSVAISLPYRNSRYNYVDSAEYPILPSSRYLQESSNALEPEIYFSASSPTVQARIWLGAIFNEVKDNPFSSFPSSRSVRCGTQVDYQIASWLSAYGMVDYQRKVYKPYDKLSRRTSNIDFSVSLSARR
jgi:hypothetical protein